METLSTSHQATRSARPDQTSDEPRLASAGCGFAIIALAGLTLSCASPTPTPIHVPPDAISQLTVLREARLAVPLCQILSVASEGAVSIVATLLAAHPPQRPGLGEFDAHVHVAYSNSDQAKLAEGHTHSTGREGLVVSFAIGKPRAEKGDSARALLASATRRGLSLTRRLHDTHIDVTSDGTTLRIQARSASPAFDKLREELFSSEHLGAAVQQLPAGAIIKDWERVMSSKIAHWVYWLVTLAGHKLFI